MQSSPGIQDIKLGARIIAVHDAGAFELGLIQFLSGSQGEETQEKQDRSQPHDIHQRMPASPLQMNTSHTAEPPAYQHCQNERGKQLPWIDVQIEQNQFRITVGSHHDADHFSDEAQHKRRKNRVQRPLVIFAQISGEQVPCRQTQGNSPAESQCQAQETWTKTSLQRNALFLVRSSRNRHHRNSPEGENRRSHPSRTAPLRGEFASAEYNWRWARESEEMMVPTGI